MIDDKMYSNVACRFSRRAAYGKEGKGLVGDEIGAWTSSAGACSRTDARGHCTESCAISSQSSKVGDEVLKIDEGIRGSAFGLSELDEQSRNMGDRYFGGSKSGGGESVTARSTQAESSFNSYQHGNDLGYAISGKRLGRSVGALGGLADSRLSTSCIVDDCASEVFNVNAMHNGAHGDFGMTTFSRLDERASEVLKKSMQALGRSYRMKSGSCLSVGPEQSRWSLNVRERGCFVPLRCGELTEFSSEANLKTMMRVQRDLISDKSEVLREVNVPGKVVGAFNDNSPTYDTMKQMSADYFIGSQEDQSSSHIPPLPAKWGDCKTYSGVESSLTDHGTDENKEGSPGRICRSTRLPGKNATTERTSIRSQIPSHLKEDLNIYNRGHGCFTHKKRYDIPENTEEEEYDTQLIHRTLNSPALRREEKSICHSKPPEFVNRWVEMQDCKRPQVSCVSGVTQGMASSLQGVSVALSSGADTIQHEPTVEKGQGKCVTVRKKGQDILETSGDSVKRSEGCAIPAETLECQNGINSGGWSAKGTEVQHETSHEEKKLANLKLHRSFTVEGHLQEEAPIYFGWGAEGDGCIQIRPNAPSKIQEAQNVSASSYNKVESGISRGDNGKLHLKAKSISAISVSSLPWQTAMDALRSVHQRKPVGSYLKMLPIIVISPPRVNVARGSYRRVMRGLKSLSQDTKRERRRTGKGEGPTEMIRQQNSPKAAPHNSATTITVNISMSPSERSGDNPINSIQVHSYGNSADSKSTQTPNHTEMAQSPTKSNRQVLEKSSRQVELTIQKPLKLRFLPTNTVSTKESSPAERLQTSKRKLRPQGDECSKARTRLISDTSPNSTKLHRGSAGLRHWPDVIPELDNWISEVVSGWLGTEEGLVRNDPENTLIKVSSRDTAGVINVSKHENHATSLKLSSLHAHKTPPSLKVTKVGKLLDIQLKRLADIDSRVSGAHSVDDLSRILDGVFNV